MVRSCLRLGGTGALLTLGLVCGSGYTSAQVQERVQTHVGHVAPVKGIVIGVADTSLQVLAQSGTTSVSLTGTTHVLRVVTGTFADLAPNEQVSVHLARGATAVDAIRIDLAGSPNHGGKSVGSVSQTTHAHTKSSAPSKKGTTVTRPIVSGTVSSVSGNIITIRGHHGQTATYTLASNVTVSKVMKGAVSDLAIGQTVQVFIHGPSNTADVVIIQAG